MQTSQTPQATANSVWSTTLKSGEQVLVRGGYGGLVAKNDDATGYVHSVNAAAGWATVRLELDDEHPAVQDAVADGHDPDQAEFVDVVPFEHLTHMDLLSNPTMDGKPVRAWSRPLTSAERAQRARSMSAEERARLIGPGMRNFGQLRTR